MYSPYYFTPQHYIASASLFFLLLLFLFGESSVFLRVGGDFCVGVQEGSGRVIRDPNIAKLTGINGTIRNMR